MKRHHRNLLIIGCCGLIVLAVAWQLFRPAPLPMAQIQVPVQPVAEDVAPPASTAPAPLAAGDEKAQPEAATLPPPLPEQVPAAAVAPALKGNHPPLIAILIDDVGLDLKGSQRAVELPPYITLSYMPYATRLREQTQGARMAGHELMLHMPMEPLGRDDPGPGALLTELPPDELRQRFDTALASFVGFDGVNNHMGSKFTADQAGMALVMDELAPRHLFFLDSRTSAQSVGFETARRRGIPALSRDVFLDDDMALSAVQKQLAQVEHIASHKGYAIAIGHPHPATLQALEQWLPQAQAAGFVFIPVHDLLPPMQSPE